MPRKPFLIGVAGGTASGKTTVCTKIMQILDQGVVLISQDSFYRGLSPEEHEHAADYDFDVPDALDFPLMAQCLATLIAGKPVELPVYDFVKHARATETKRILPAPVIIVEGILVLAVEEVRKLFNMKIFVDTDDDVRLARRIQRDTVERGRDVAGILTQYTRFVKPSFDFYVQPSRKHADVIIPWAQENNNAIDLIVQHIKSKLGISDLRALYSNLHILPSNYQVRAMLTFLRDRKVEGHTFQFFAERLVRLVVECGLGYLPYHDKEVITPSGQRYPGVGFGGNICGVSIIRSGETMEGALRNCCLGIRIGKVLIKRMENASSASEDRQIVYENFPADIAKRWVFLMDPVIGSGHTGCAAIDLLLRRGVKEERIICLSVLAAETGIHLLFQRYPKIKIITVEIDEEANGLIPGLGVFGDRYFGTCRTTVLDECDSGGTSDELDRVFMSARGQSMFYE